MNVLVDIKIGQLVKEQVTKWESPGRSTCTCGKCLLNGIRAAGSDRALRDPGEAEDSSEERECIRARKRAYSAGITNLAREGTFGFYFILL